MRTPKRKRRGALNGGKVLISEKFSGLCPSTLDT
jgi:hypothetical protein